jgi:hypothetical protein
MGKSKNNRDKDKRSYYKDYAYDCHNRKPRKKRNPDNHNSPSRKFDRTKSV